MSQIFSPSANSYARGSIVALVLIVAALGLTLDRLSRSPYVTRAETVREQPVQFSHQHHVGGLGIDCRYCHTSVQVSSYAGIPPTQTCMSCHSQIWADSPMLEPVRESYRTDRSLEWVKVHDLADYVYFNHSIHLKKGVGCDTCHGRVDRMPLVWREASLQMEWCLECHREPERFVRPREEIFNAEWTPPDGDQLALGERLVAEYEIRKLDECSTCHR